MASSKKIRGSMMPKCQYAKYPKKFIMEMLEIYKNSPCLWKTKSEEYFDRAKKDIAYNIVVDKLQEVEKFPDRKMAISFFGALRFYYRKQLKLVERGKKPTLWYFEHLDFLREYLYCNRRNDSIGVIVDDSVQMESSVDNDNSADLSAQSLSPLASNIQNDSNTIAASIQIESSTDSNADLSCSSLNYSQSEINSNQQYHQNQQYEDSIVANVEEVPSMQYFTDLSKTWANILRSLSSQQQIIAEKLINDIIYEAHMDKLNDQSPVDILNVLQANN